MLNRKVLYLNLKVVRQDYQILTILIVKSGKILPNGTQEDSRLPGIESKSLFPLKWMEGVFQVLDAYLRLA